MTLNRQRGMTLVELLVAMTLMSLVVVVFGPVMTGALSSGNRTQQQSENLDQLRLAATSISRELRSARCIYQPALPAGATEASGSTLDFETHAEVGSLQDYRVVYVVTADGKLTRQVDGATTTTVISGMVDPSTTFKQLKTPRRSVVLTLRVQLDSRQGVQQQQTLIAGRSAWREC